jgi:hypothetical protein
MKHGFYLFFPGRVLTESLRVHESGISPFVQAVARLCLTSNSIAQKEGHNFSDLALFAFALMPVSDDFMRIDTKANNLFTKQD